jgi:hypothetical protein
MAYNLGNSSAPLVGVPSSLGANGGDSKDFDTALELEAELSGETVLYRTSMPRGTSHLRGFQVAQIIIGLVLIIISGSLRRSDSSSPLWAVGVIYGFLFILYTAIHALICSLQRWYFVITSKRLLAVKRTRTICTTQMVIVSFLCSPSFHISCLYV